MQQNSRMGVKKVLATLTKTSITILAIFFLVSAVWAATDNVLYNFAGGSGDGESPTSGLVADRDYNLYDL